MYNLVEYSDDYFMTSRNLWNYGRDEVNKGNENNTAGNCRINNNKATASKHFKYKTKIIGNIRKTPINNNP